MSGNTIIVTCMDHRLNSMLDSLNDSKHVFVRNAGGNVQGVEQTIRYLIDNTNISKIHIIAHTDCGAMGYVYSAVKEGKDNVHKQLVSLFNSIAFESRAELEKKNEELQRSIAEKLFGGKGIEISSELFELKEKNVASEKHVIAITRASYLRYSDIAEKMGVDVKDVYFLQANSVEELLGDIAIGTDVLGIKDIRVVATESSEYRPSLIAFEKLKARGIGDKAKLSLVKL